MNKNKYIPQMRPWLGEEECNAIINYLKEDGWLTEYKKTEEFEHVLAEYLGVKHCIVVSNGTVALTLVGLALGIKYGDDVIVPNYTMIATPNSMKLIGANPVFVDVESETLCLDFSLLEKSLTPRTKAIILVSPNGRYPKCGIDKFLKFAEEHKLFLIEDAAQALGSFYPDGNHIGTVGIAGTLSFSMPKIITTGQGGAVITNDDDIAFKIRRLKDFGRIKSGIDIHESIGFNFKFTDIQAVIGIEQMKKLKYRIARKKEIYKLYQEGLKNIKQVHLFNQDLINTTPWFIDILCENRDALANYLNENGIGTRLMYPPINKQQAYNIIGYFPVSEKVGKMGLWLPSFTQITNEEIFYICDKIKDFYS